MWNVMSYENVCQMDPLVFVGYLEGFKVQVPPPFEDPASAMSAGQAMATAANNYSALDSLRNYIMTRKRQCKEAGEQKMYKDLIDKEAATQSALHAIDMQYKAISKLLTIYNDMKKELYMTEGFYAAQPRQQKRNVN